MPHDILFISIGLVIGGMITALAYPRLFKPDKASTEHLEYLNKQLEELKANLNNERKQSEKRSAELVRVETENSFLEKQNREKIEEIKNIQSRLTSEFEVIANKIITQKSKELSEKQNRDIATILDPLKTNIQAFEKKVSDTYEKELRDKLSLQAEVKKLYELNHKISTEAENLTKALKGDVKKMGNWGEVILERILEDSGLTKGREYQREVVDTNEEGKVIRPDVVIYLPENKHIIIDSKLSLVAYERYVSSDDPKEKETYLKAHVESMRKHVKGLFEKNYSTAKKLNSPDFVLMFLPLESSFAAAVEGDTKLFSFAWEHKIVPVSPSTLLATLRIIASIWKQEKQSRNALEIARQGGALYDKLAGLMEDIKKIGNSITQLQTNYDAAVNKLSSGKGNLLSRAEKIKQLGAKTSKNITDSSFNPQLEE
jgi:DNA recombination protein RmuC